MTVTAVATLNMFLKRIYIILLASLFLVLLFSLERAGRTARIFLEPYALAEKDIPIVFVHNAAELFSLWRRSGVHGRVVIHFGTFLHFVDSVDDEDREAHLPAGTIDSRRVFGKVVNNENYLLAAMEEDIAREIYSVLPPDIYAEKREHIDRDEEGICIGEERIVVSHYGSRRLIQTMLPEVVEPVLMHIDASYFNGVTPEELIEKLRRSTLRTDLLTLSLADDNPDVSAAERERLKKLARLLYGGKIRP